MKHRTGNAWVSVLPVLVATLFLAAGASAARLDIENSASGTTIGAVSWSGGTDPLFGIDIEFDSIIGVDTLNFAGDTLACSGCTLNFETGPLDGDASGPDTLVWQSGGTFILTGTIPEQDIDFDTVPDFTPAFTGTILSGTVNQASAEIQDTGVGPRTLEISLTGPDTKEQQLVEFFFGPGFPLTFGFSETNISVELPNDFDLGDPFDDPPLGVGEADLLNFPARAVPEPSATLLALMGLAGLGLWRRLR